MENPQNQAMTPPKCQPKEYELFIDYHLYEHHCTNNQGKNQYQIIRPTRAIPPMKLHYPTTTVPVLKTLIFQHINSKTHNYTDYPIGLLAQQADAANSLNWSYVVAEPGWPEKYGAICNFNYPSQDLFERFKSVVANASPCAIVWVHLGMQKPGDICVVSPPSCFEILVFPIQLILIIHGSLLSSSIHWMMWTLYVAEWPWQKRSWHNYSPNLYAPNMT